MKIIVCLLLLSLVSVHGQMSTRLLRDVINPDPTTRDRLLEGLDAAVLDEIPYVGSNIHYLTSLLEFVFILEEEGTDSPHFRISAIEISSLSGVEDCEMATGDLSQITELQVEIGTVTETSVLKVSSYQEGDLLDMSRLGLGPNNELIRFAIPPLDGDLVMLVIEDTTNISLPICLQVEFIGRQLTTQSMPPPPRTLLQYNIRTPNFAYTRTAAYTDVSYTGIMGTKWTGGTGNLMDGRIGTDPTGSPDEWVGFTESAGMRIFFSKEYPVSQILVYYWSDLVNEADAPTGEARDKSGNRIQQLAFRTEVYDTDLPNLQVYIGEASVPVMLDFIELPLRTTSQGLLVTEVSVLQLINGESVDIATGLFDDEIEFVPEIIPATSIPLTQIIIYASVATIASFVLTIVVMCIVFAVIFWCMRAGLKKDIIRAKSHPSIIRQLSDKYINPSCKPNYDQFQQPDETYSEIGNVYHEIERHVTLPLPPIPTEESKRSPLPKDDSYIEMQATPEARQNPKIHQMSEMKSMRTFSEDDYVPVTPPHSSGPDRQISDPYVAVTPPEDDRIFNLTQIEERNEPDTASASDAMAYNMEKLGRNSLPNAYVTMATKDTPM